MTNVDFKDCPKGTKIYGDLTFIIDIRESSLSVSYSKLIIIMNEI